MTGFERACDLLRSWRETGDAVEQRETLSVLQRIRAHEGCELPSDPMENSVAWRLMRRRYVRDYNLTHFEPRNWSLVPTRWERFKAWCREWVE